MPQAASTTRPPQALQAARRQLGGAVGGDQDGGQAGRCLLRLLDRLLDGLALEALAEAGVFKTGGEEQEVGIVVAGVMGSLNAEAESRS